jgi:hypothetical protein
VAGQTPSAAGNPPGSTGGGVPGGRALGAVTNASNTTGTGAALPVGLGALALVVILAGMDYARARRARLFDSRGEA